jgi:hypothetical protein
VFSPFVANEYPCRNKRSRKTRKMFQGKKYGYTFAVSKGKTIQRQQIKIKKE